MARATQPVGINGIEFDALIEATKNLSADVPSYPTEEGFEVSDAIILKPVTLSMTLYLTNTPVTWKERHGLDSSRVSDVVKQLEELYFSRQPVTVSTSERTYENMAILSLELKKTKETGPSREIPIEFQQIRVTESRTTTIPDNFGRGGATGVNAGPANTKASDTPAAGDGRRNSILYGLTYGGGDSASDRHGLAGLSGLFGGG
jgi:hypothetical protein